LALTLIIAIMLCSLVSPSYGQPKQLLNDGNGNVSSGNKTNEPVATGNWTKYNDDKLGIAFQYPSGWNIEEKQNASDSRKNVTVSSGNIKFVVLKAINMPKDDPLKSSDIARSTRILKNAAGAENATIVKETDTKKYRIGGERTATFITRINDNVSAFKLQDFFVIHDGDGYLLAFRAPVEIFDEPDSQKILNKIMRTFKFLK